MGILSMSEIIGNFKSGLKGRKNHPQHLFQRHGTFKILFGRNVDQYNNSIYIWIWLFLSGVYAFVFFPTIISSVYRGSFTMDQSVY